MAERLAALLDVDREAVSVKASSGNLAGEEGAGRVISASCLVQVTSGMSLHFRNTLGGSIEEFVPLEPGHVRMYTCGPTVYAPAHVGNFRSFVFADLVRRTLLFSGYRVTWVMNITDVDDKIIRDANAAGIGISRADRASHGAVPGGHDSPRHPGAGRHAARHRPHR